ncbi:MAG: NUDIX hydrolase [Planctomycetota bacterium]
MPFTYEYARPAVTVDVVLFDLAVPTKPRVLLIRRRRAPFRGRWALPGGFVDPHEDLEDAARRELREETGIEVGSLWQLGAYGTPGRDPRGHTISVVFCGAADAAAVAAVRAGDDAADCGFRPAQRPGPLAFDHADILRDARALLPVLREAAGAGRRRGRR